MRVNSSKMFKYVCFHKKYFPNIGWYLSKVPGYGLTYIVCFVCVCVLFTSILTLLLFSKATSSLISISLPRCTQGLGTGGSYFGTTTSISPSASWVLCWVTSSCTCQKANYNNLVVIHTKWYSPQFLRVQRTDLICKTQQNFILLSLHLNYLLRTVSAISMNKIYIFITFL